MDQVMDIIMDAERRAHVLERNQFVLESAEPDRVVISTTVRPDIVNLYGVVHGGVLLYLADVTSGLTALTDGRRYVTQNTSCQFFTNTKEGKIFSEGTIVHRGRSVTSVRVKISDEQGKLMFESLFSMFTVQRELLPESTLNQ